MKEFDISGMLEAMKLTNSLAICTSGYSDWDRFILGTHTETFSSRITIIFYQILVLFLLVGIIVALLVWVISEKR